MTIKRYHADVISEHAEGSIVLYADHAAELEAQAARIRELEACISAERDRHFAERARKLSDLRAELGCPYIDPPKEST